MKTLVLNQCESQGLVISFTSKIQRFFVSETLWCFQCWNMLVFLEFSTFSNFPSASGDTKQKQPIFSTGRLLRRLRNNELYKWTDRELGKCWTEISLLPWDIYLKSCTCRNIQFYKVKKKNKQLCWLTSCLVTVEGVCMFYDLEDSDRG